MKRLIFISLIIGAMLVGCSGSDDGGANAPVSANQKAMPVGAGAGAPQAAPAPQTQ